jgi:uncharacterized protein (TIGR02217 family)
MSITVLPDVILPNSVISSGVRGKNMRRNDRVQTDSGDLSINIGWTSTLREFEVGIVPMRVDQWRAIETLHEITEGGAYGFLMEDPKDNHVTSGGALAELESGGYQLVKRYADPRSGRTKDRRITRPQPGTVQFYLDGALSEFAESSVDAPRDMRLIVLTAYAALGRFGTGPGAGDIDSGGFDYWLTTLKNAGGIPSGFLMDFFYSAANYASGPESVLAHKIIDSIISAVNVYGTDIDIATEVLTAYAAIGRIGIGTTDQSVDEAGYLYWVTQVKSGATTLESFMLSFMSSVKNYTPSVVSPNYINEVAIANEMLDAFRGVSTTPSFYGRLVLGAYASVGRRGFGIAVNNIERAGYNYWLATLTNGAPVEVFYRNFLVSSATRTGTDEGTKASNILGHLSGLSGDTMYSTGLVYMAYGALGHYDIGGSDTNIDLGGFQFWMSQLSTPGADRNFLSDFMTSVARFSGLTTPPDYTDEITRATDLLSEVTLLANVDYKTGIVTLPAGTDPASITWQGKFYVPVHFMDDVIDWELVAPGSADTRFLAGPSVVLQEIRE